MSKLTVLTDADHVAPLHSDGAGYALTPAQAMDLGTKLIAAAAQVDAPPSVPGIEVTKFVASTQGGGQ